MAANATIKSIIKVVDEASPQLKVISDNHKKVSDSVKKQRDAQQLLNSINSKANAAEKASLSVKQQYLRELSKLTEHLSAGTITTKQHGVAVKQLRSIYKNLETQTKRNNKVVDEASPQLKAISDNHKKVSDSVKKQRDAQQLLNAINSKANAVEKASLSVKQQYLRELSKLTDHLRAGTISTKQHSTAVKQLRVVYKNLEQQTKRNRTSASQLRTAYKNLELQTKRNNEAMLFGRSMSRGMRAGFGQLGHQIQDVAVQLQMGQNAMLVFSQQGSQIASLFGPGGAVAGGIMAVGGAIAMALIPTLFDSKDAMEELETATRDADSALSDISDMDAIKKKYGAVTNIIKEMIRFQNTARIKELRVKGLGAIKEQAEGVGKVFDELNRAIRFSENPMDVYEGSVIAGQAALATQVKVTQKTLAQQRVAQKLGLSIKGNTKDVLELNDAFNRLDKSVSFEDKHKELNNIFNVMQRIRSDESANVTPAFEQIQATITDLALKGRGTLEVIEQLQEAMKFRDTDAALSAREEAEKLIASLDPAAKYDEEIKAIDKLKAKAPELAEALTAVQQKLKDQRDAALGAKSALQEYAEASVDLQKSLDSHALKGVKALEDGLVDLISGTKNASLAFRDMARSIISDLIRMQVQQSITQPLAGLLNQFVPNVANSIGNFMFGGTPTLSSSNYVGSGEPAQTFPYNGFAGGGFTGNGPRSGGVDGKGGFPAILHPNETVIDHAQGQSAGTVINQTINVTTGVQQTVRTEIMGLLPQIAEASKAAVLDARRRGGSFAGAF